MNRSMFKTLGKVVLGLSFACALSTMNLGCHHCGEPCKSSNCDKPCTKKVAEPCPAGCTKPCCKHS
jgi:hypothetical protein